MSFFTRMYLNTRRRGARQLMSNPQAMHAAVASAFAPGSLDGLPGRPLWRLDVTDHEAVLYMSSPVQPDLSHIVEQAGWAQAGWDTVDYTKLLSRVENDQLWGFRLTANPVVQTTKDGVKKALPHVTPAQQVQWLMKKAATSGFEVIDADVSHKVDLKFKRNEKSAVSLRRAQFDGVLRVTDADQLRSSMINGLGRGKAYGMGLMTLRSV